MTENGLDDHATASPTAPARPTVTFRCGECCGPLGHDPDLQDQLICQNAQCSAAGMPVAVWRAQRARVRRGEDVPAPGAGWPRPVLDGRAHPWVTPVSNGTPWWTLLDGARQARAQDAWLCQMCGQPLDAIALVVLREKKVLSDAGLHPRCLHLAAVVCPHLAASGARYAVAEVTRSDLRADGRPLPPIRPDAAEDDGHLWTPAWTLTHPAASRVSPLCQHQATSRPSACH
ncbi:hypothetical protein [Amycolatopsis sp. DG1A-15b]|uniref:hypothetical protein n=1 Tax=Amycolatopsis sp. DG1A-15b TaxID=3052846 RepID=UPI00255B4A8E|nr:hypothetical protein [Amycolatopsis sp. DG1A-15b]WIX85835.1 hypothetical protein QRY02_32115 [Amycolatopsis sp. DG1A-15b]